MITLVVGKYNSDMAASKLNFLQIFVNIRSLLYFDMIFGFFNINAVEACEQI